MIDKEVQYLKEVVQWIIYKGLSFCFLVIKKQGDQQAS